MKACIYILVMAVTTYLIRAVPLALLRKPIKSRFIRSFLHYVPVACLTAMTFPAILYTTDNVLSGALGLAVAVVLSLWKRSLLTVALASCATVFFTELILHFV